jgi:hypothetical protein
MPTLKEIADGADFDKAHAIRQICQHLTATQPLAVSSPIPDAPNYIPTPTTVLPERIADLLKANGYSKPESIAQASDEALRHIDGIGPATLKEIRSLYPRPKN